MKCIRYYPCLVLLLWWNTDQNQLERRNIYSVYSSTSQSVMKGNQSRSSIRTRGRGHGGMLFFHAQISYTTQDHLPSHTTSPRKLCPPISTSIKKMLYRLPRVQSGGGNISSEVPSFPVSSACIKTSKWTSNLSHYSNSQTVLVKCFTI